MFSLWQISERMCDKNSCTLEPCVGSAAGWSDFARYCGTMDSTSQEVHRFCSTRTTASSSSLVHQSMSFAWPCAGLPHPLVRSRISGTWRLTVTHSVLGAVWGTLWIRLIPFVHAVWLGCGSRTAVVLHGLNTWSISPSQLLSLEYLWPYLGPAGSTSNV